MLANIVKKIVCSVIIIPYLLNFPFSAATARADMVQTKIICRVNAVNINWWDNFSDEYLKDYIYKALERNHDLRKAALKTEEYRELVKVTMSKEFPTLQFSPTFARIKTAQNTIFDIETAALRSNLYVLPLFATYEADIFLKNHDKTKSKRKEYEAKQ